MLSFYSRKGLKIKPGVWARLTRKPGYCVVMRDEFENGGMVLLTSWVGVLSDMAPDDRGIFLVELYEFRKRRQRRVRLAADHWFWHEKDAVKCHSDIKRELQEIAKS